MKVRIKIDSTDKILSKRKLGSSGEAQQMFTRECAKAMNPYIPYKTGTLKDLDVKINKDNIVYFAPYARRQYFTNKGNGLGGTNKGGIRGKMWAERMWNDKGEQIVNNICSYVGGKRV